MFAVIQIYDNYMSEIIKPFKKSKATSRILHLQRRFSTPPVI
jgi:hypothetical protein